MAIVEDCVKDRPHFDGAVDHEGHGETSAFVKVKQVFHLVFFLFNVDALLVIALVCLSLLQQLPLNLLLLFFLGLEYTFELRNSIFAENLLFIVKFEL